MAQLHNPVQNVEVLKESVAAKEVHFKNNVVSLASNDGPIKFHKVVKGSVCVDVNELRNRGEVLEKVNELGFAPGGTVIKMNSRIEKYVSELKRDYEARGFHSDQINFWDAENQNTFQFEANPVSRRIWTPLDLDPPVQIR